MNQGVTVACDAKDVMNKIKHLEDKFRAAHDWTVKETGAGLEESDPPSFQAAVKKICPMYFDLLPIMGERSSANPIIDTDKLDEMSDNTDDEKSAVDGHKASKDCLCAGDVIFYYHPIYVAGSQEAIRVTQILGIDCSVMTDKEDTDVFPLDLQNGDLLPTDTYVKRVKIFKNGMLKDHEGISCKIHDYILKSGKLGNETGMSLQLKSFDKIVQDLQKELQKPIPTTTQGLSDWSDSERSFHSSITRGNNDGQLLSKNIGKQGDQSLTGTTVQQVDNQTITTTPATNNKTTTTTTTPATNNKTPSTISTSSTRKKRKGSEQESTKKTKTPRPGSRQGGNIREDPNYLKIQEDFVKEKGRYVDEMTRHHTIMEDIVKNKSGTAVWEAKSKELEYKTKLLEEYKKMKSAGTPDNLIMIPIIELSNPAKPKSSITDSNKGCQK